MTVPAIEDLLRECAPQVLGALVRRYGQFEGSEDAVQEAVLAASVQWPAEGVPDNPRGWLMTVASRRMVDQMRSDHARRERETALATDVTPAEVPDVDDTLLLLFLCCHPALTAASQTALTLRAVGGLSTAEIARAFLVPEATMAARISRAKQRIKAAGSTFTASAERLPVVLHVLYLIFNEGYTASSGSDLHRVGLAREAIRLARMVHARLPDDSEVTGLLALMLLTDARREARTTASGDLVPLAEQDRTRWNRALADEGMELAKASLGGAALGPYQLQAAIAATHADAATAEETDWRQVHALYLILERIAPNPMVTLNRAIALAETEGPPAGLELLASLDGDERMAGHHRLLSVRAHLLEKAGDRAGAYEAYRQAAKATASLAERRYLESRARAARVPSVDAKTDELRAAHDVLAEWYVDKLDGMLEQMPAERAVLDLFCELTLAAGLGCDVADIGCGTGRLVPYLAGRGVAPRGVDLSPGMVEVARREYPEFSFDVADVRDLPFEDASLAGAVCWYSLFFLAPEERPAAYRELARVVKPGGYLVIAYKAGDGGVRRGGRGVGLGVEFDTYWLSPQEVEQRCVDAGFTTVFWGGRPPEANRDYLPAKDGAAPPEVPHGGYLLARRG